MNRIRAAYSRYRSLRWLTIALVSYLSLEFINQWFETSRRVRVWEHKQKRLQRFRNDPVVGYRLKPNAKEPIHWPSLRVTVRQDTDKSGFHNKQNNAARASLVLLGGGELEPVGLASQFSLQEQLKSSLQQPVLAYGVEGWHLRHFRMALQHYVLPHKQRKQLIVLLKRSDLQFYSPKQSLSFFQNLQKHSRASKTPPMDVLRCAIYECSWRCKHAYKDKKTGKVKSMCPAWCPLPARKKNVYPNKPGLPFFFEQHCFQWRQTLLPMRLKTWAFPPWAKCQEGFVLPTLQQTLYYPSAALVTKMQFQSVFSELKALVRTAHSATPRREISFVWLPTPTRLYHKELEWRCQGMGVKQRREEQNIVTRLRQMAHSLNAPFYDTTTLFSRHKKKGIRPFFQQLPFLNATGHRILADYLRTKVIQ